jgi:UDP-GlcNAc:undecaprenyl-phosphate GlcNAc-1-phosphate transferase
MLIAAFVAFFVTCLVLIGVILFMPRQIGSASSEDGGGCAARVPLWGGLAILCGLWAGTLMLPVRGDDWQLLLLLASLLGLLGAVDDWRGLSVQQRLVGLLLIGVLMIHQTGVYLDDLGRITGALPYRLEDAAVPLTLLAIVGVSNAFNMIDGLDGLAGGLAFLLFAVLFGLLLQRGDSPEAATIALLLASLAAFLLFNFRIRNGSRARIMLGDSGTLMLGFLIAALLIRYSQQEQPLLRPVTALWLFAIPLMDTLSLFVRRLAQGRSPVRPDRQHLHHLLLQRGYAARAAVNRILLGALLLSLVGLVGEYLQVSEALMFGLFLLMFLVYFSVTGWYSRELGSLDAQRLSDRRGRR